LYRTNGQSRKRNPALRSLPGSDLAPSGVASEVEGPTNQVGKHEVRRHETGDSNAERGMRIAEWVNGVIEAGGGVRSGSGPAAAGSG